jgi:two-component system, OmpR family, alkaline phosphatase synthesis response regulator PhoP
VAQRIVIIEDERDIIELVKYNFRKEGFELESFSRGKEGLEHLRRSQADLVLIDILLPDLDGFEICKRLRADERLKSVPVIFLTAKSEEIDRVLGLEIGADDYVVKPFSPRELVARVKAVLRRQERAAEKPEVVEAGDLVLDSRTQEVRVRGRVVDLSTLEFKLLHFLASNPRRIFSRDRLLDAVWGLDRFVTARTVDVHIRRLREKIESQSN